MAIDDKIRDEKMQNDIEREATKIPALSQGKIGKYECLTGKEMLSLLILPQKMFYKNKQQLKIKEKNKHETNKISGFN